MSYDAAVHAWVEHLRAGGTTPWDARRWSLAADPADPADPAAPAPPSAVHLALLHRLNLAGHGPAPAGLAEVLLGTPRPGRGPVDPPLPWTDPPRFGSPPRSPADLDPDLLLVLASAVLVRLLAGTGGGRATDAPAPGPASRGTARPARRPARRLARRLARRPLGRRGFRLHGTHLAVRAVREQLLDAGAVEGGRRPVHLVLGQPLETALAEHWAGRIGRGATLGWGALWRRTTTADRLPHPVDVDRLAEQVAADERGRVLLVLGADHAALAAACLDALGRAAAPGVAATAPVLLARWDLQRRVNRLAPLARGPVSGTDLVARLLPVLRRLAREHDRSTAPAPAVPEAHAAAAARVADDLATRVRDGGYRVLGDPGILARTTPGGAPGRDGPVDPDATLDLALAACVQLWSTQEGPRP
ncbi:hypothetical protein ASG49_13440 [Marmoricola sp. Leaf446]|uniref:hypothetical protein n=1 Tax=Marmoricola sp. Leaf446 TaxID=1736379 RepID=UPI0006F6A3AA|nr:hypothetical protein [Marmoricola sp. Leaf446]KQT90746.1 hypothetical protein ASG49_13440 [Marmoricola sp. Leaf446]